tara:strand:+ start:237 stop:419 length:183 start_codon:yes stop_codon:yes gene_type:complete
MVITWNTGLAAARVRAKLKSEPRADPARIKKLHESWAQRNGYRGGGSGRKRQAAGALKKP